MKPLDVCAALFVVLVWGMNFIAIKFGIEAVPPLIMMAIRSTIAGLILVWWVPVPKGHFKQIIALAFVMGGVHFGTLAVGMTGVDVSMAAIITQLGVPFSAILARIILKDLFGWRRAMGMVIAFMGVAILIGVPKESSGVPYIIMMIVCAFTWGLGNVMIKRLGDINILSLMAYLMLFSAPIQFIGSLVFETGQLPALQKADWAFWAAVVYMAIGSSIIGYALWYSLIRKYDISSVAPFGLLAPVIATIAAVIVFGEDFGWQKILGAGLTMTGVAIIQLRWKRPATQQM